MIEYMDTPTKNTKVHMIGMEVFSGWWRIYIVWPGTTWCEWTCMFGPLFGVYTPKIYGTCVSVL